MRKNTLLALSICCAVCIVTMFVGCDRAPDAAGVGPTAVATNGGAGTSTTAANAEVRLSFQVDGMTGSDAQPPAPDGRSGRLPPGMAARNAVSGGANDPSVRGAVGVPQVTVRMISVNLGNTASPTTRVEQTAQVASGTGVDFVFTVPAKTTVAQVSVVNGTIAGRSEFHGAADLVAGPNTIVVNPVGSRLARDVVATVLMQIVNDPRLFASATANLAGAITQAISTVNRQSVTAYIEAMNLVDRQVLGGTGTITGTTTGSGTGAGTGSGTGASTGSTTGSGTGTGVSTGTGTGTGTGVALSSAKVLTAFAFMTPVVTGAIDETEKTIAVTVPFGTSVSSLIASFAVSPNATVKIGATAQTSGTTANSFVTPRMYTVIAQDGSQQSYLVTVAVAAGPVANVTAAITTTAANPTNVSPIPVTVTFNTDVADFTSSDVVVTNGTLANFAATGPRIYTFNIASSRQGEVSVVVAAGAAHDVAGNGNAAALLNTVYDNVAPAVTVTALNTNSTTPTLTGTVEIGVATVTVRVNSVDYAAVVNGSAWAAAVTTALSNATTYDVAVSAVDAAGNFGHDATSNELTVDTNALTVAVTSTVGNPTNVSPIPVTVTFSKGVVGFVPGCVSVFNGVLSGFSATSASVYTFNVTPAGQGAVQVSVGANVVHDAAGTGNQAGSFNTTYDSVAPGVVLSTTAPNPTNGAIPVTLTFSEDVTGFVDADVVVVNGSKSAFTNTTPNRVWTLTVTPNPGAAVVVTVDIAANAAQDAVDNGNTVATQLSRTYDNVAPTAPTGVTLTPIGGTVLANTLNTTNTNLTAQATIAAGGATGGEAELLLDGRPFWPAVKDTTIAAGDTTVSFDLGLANNAAIQALFAAGSHQLSAILRDAAGNSSNVSVGNPTLVVDCVPPTYNAAAIVDALHIDVTFSEPMGAAVTTAAKYTISGTGKGALLTAQPDSVTFVSGNTWRLTWNAGKGDMVPGGTITVTAVGDLTDVVSNPLNAGQLSATTGAVTPLVTIEYVTVGNPNNAVDPANGAVYGVVDHTFEMGKYLVTNAQYSVFLNAVDPNGANPNGIYSTDMTSQTYGGIIYTAGNAAGSKYSPDAGKNGGMQNRPVNYVSYYAAARFANWLYNGGLVGSNVNTGAYTITGETAIDNARTGGNTGGSNRVFLPTENEWYKAAYYRGVSNTYTLYPWGNTDPDANGRVGANIVANWAFTGAPGNVSAVTAYPFGVSHYGTFDQAGNVSEWNETIHSGSSRVVRGGGFNNLASGLRSSYRVIGGPAERNFDFGFRVCR